MIYSRHKDVIKRNVGGEIFLIPIKNRLADMDNIYALHGIAEFIWDRLDGKNDLSALCAMITDEFEISADEAMADLKELTAGMVKSGLLSEA